LPVSVSVLLAVSVSKQMVLVRVESITGVELLQPDLNLTKTFIIQTLSHTSEKVSDFFADRMRKPNSSHLRL